MKQQILISPNRTEQHPHGRGFSDETWPKPMEKWPSNSGTNVNNECGVKESRQERERKPARPISSAHATTHCTTHVLSTS